MTTADTATPDEKGTLEDAFSGTAESTPDDVFGFLKLGGPGAPTLNPSGGDMPSDESAEVAIPSPAAPAEAAESPAEAEEQVEPQPTPDAPKSAWLAYYERMVDRERERYKDTVTAADRRFVERASGPLYAINADKLYLELVSLETGKPFTKFKDYLKERWGISRAHGYRILNEYPVMTALGDMSPPKLSTRQTPVLLKVLRSRGKEDWAEGEAAVRKVWTESPSKSPADLEATVQSLGWDDAEAAALDDLSDSEQERPTLVARWDRAVGELDPVKVREVLASNPGEAQRLLERVRPVVAVLEELSQIQAPSKRAKKG
ncbi:hypothetical protein [Streptomyces sp. NPDC001536]|uniref:hypothetical protein n=1 Tax=Streptomyces sp. NPDC001536 TaxID=3364583 RepID=UPI0036CFAEC2